MSDYISREAMSETPKCPYCGDGMKIRVSLTTPDWGLLSAQYKCMTCESTSPRIEFSGGTSNEKIIERLQAVSSRRAEPKNRVLTLEEVAKSEVMWYEQRTMQGVRVVILGYAQNEPGFTQLINYLGDKFYRRDDAYNDFWRCWLRKPTEAERRGTPWES
jgi:DNA-directed RNA polymerase subunit RPC12/RpoP